MSDGTIEPGMSPDQIAYALGIGGSGWSEEDITAAEDIVATEGLDVARAAAGTLSLTIMPPTIPISTLVTIPLPPVKVPAIVPTVPVVPVIPTPAPTLVDTMISWVGGLLQPISDVIVRIGNQIISNIASAIISWVNYAIGTFTSLLGNVLDWIQNIWNVMSSTYSLVSNWVSNAYQVVSSAVSSIITPVWAWLQNLASSITYIISSTFSTLWQNISSTLSSFWASLSGWFREVKENISSFWQTITSSIGSFFADQYKLITGFWSDWYKQRASDVAELKNFMVDKIVKPLNAWWDSFLNRILDFPSWVGKLFDAIGSWLTVDVPGHSPRWTSIFETIGHWFATWFYEFPKWFFGDIPERTAYGLATSFKWVTDALSPLVGIFVSSIDQFARQIGPIAPSMVGTNASSLITMGMGVIGGLFGMTVAGELLHPLKQIGLGHLAAVIFDMTNYKMITAALVGAITYTMIRRPAGYYYNSLLRPSLPNARDANELYSKDLIPREQYGRLLSYEGFADEWHDKYADMAYRPVSLYTLASLANTGVFDEALFADNLRDWGLNPRWRPLLLAMYRNKSLETTKGLMSSVAITRYKEGLTDDSSFPSELSVLRYTDKEIPLIIAGAKMSYATDYATDLMTAYQNAVRTGKMTLDEYRQALLSLGLVPERVEGKVLIERARIKPKEKLTPIGPPEEIYLTDQGKIIMDTITRKRQKNTLTRDEEIAELLNLGMPVDYAKAIADNDDVKLLEKVLLETKEVPPLYETDAGKVAIDTIRRNRRKLLIDHAAEVKELMGLDMPDYYAEALADNDDVRLTEKGAP